MNKNQLIEKLIKEDKTSFEEGLILAETNQKEYVYVPIYPSYPLQPYWSYPYYITSPSTGSINVNEPCPTTFSGTLANTTTDTLVITNKDNLNCTYTTN